MARWLTTGGSQAVIIAVMAASGGRPALALALPQASRDPSCGSDQDSHTRNSEVIL